MPTVSLDPSKISFGTLYKCEKAFGIKVFPLVKKLEKSEGGIDFEEFSIEEIMTLTMLALDITGENPTRESIMDMSFLALKESFANLATAEVNEVDPF